MKSFAATPRWVARYGPPVLVFALVLAGWEAYVRLRNVPAYILPSPSLVLETLFTDRATLFPALLATLKTTFGALSAAVIGGAGLAILFTQWKWVERSFLPFAIVLQVTPIIAIAPLLLIYLEAPAAVLVCAFLVAFFPILSNTALGLASADRNLVDLFKLYRATRWQTLLHLRLPAALRPVVYRFTNSRLINSTNSSGPAESRSSSPASADQAAAAANAASVPTAICPSSTSNP